MKIRVALRLAHCAGALVAIYVGLLWFNAAPKGNIHTGDTDNLVKGTRVLSSCLSNGTFKGCGFHPGTRVTDVFPYPLLQYLPAFALVQRGWSDDRVVGALARLSIVCFALTLVLIAVAFARPEQRHLRNIALVAVLGSSATYQSTAAFGEMLAAMCVLAVVVAVLRERVLLIALAALIACLGKETLFPFVIGLGYLAGRRPQEWLPRRPVLVALLGGSFGGAALSFSFNVFRFGTPKNLFYLDPLFSTPGWRRRFVFLVAQWLSPSAGIFAFWPIASAIVLTATIIGVRRLVLARTDLLTWGPPLAAIVLIVGFTAGLALWVSPFGWIAYGPRLAVPILPAGVVVALHVTQTELRSLARVARANVVVLVLAVVVTVGVAWPQFGAPWSHADAVQQLIAADSTCPRMTDYSVQADASQYYHCITHTMWRWHPLPLDDAAENGGGVALVARLLLAGACALLLVDATRRGTEAPPTDGSTLVDEPGITTPALHDA